MNIKITGTGSFIPSIIEKNNDFLDHIFLTEEGIPFKQNNETIISKFKAITGIGERRYAKNEFKASDLAFEAAQKALSDANVDKEKLDYIIVAHNYGDIAHGSVQSDTVPSIASRVKHLLRIKNNYCVAYDLLFGCPGWIEAIIQAQAFMKAGMAQKCLVIGCETLSRVIDIHDRDSMIYSDGAGAAILENKKKGHGILAHETLTCSYDEAFYIFFGSSYNKNINQNTRFIKMYGRKIYEFAITQVPMAMKACFEKSGEKLSNLKKIFIHQANEKMDEAIVKRFYKLYDEEVPEFITPMNIHKLGNSSVATVPTLFDMVRKGKLKNQELHKGDVIIFASVGAGMNINAVVYKY
ncbi:ketoacyl-ACP synthase III [Ascidiimonas aurantiaca]|uniref:3-oxoacyl-ACP synthase III family protein n=1 Tax=Ascidiimonas aurantiaca TaxID=1685432 RepID=UPI0030EC561A